MQASNMCTSELRGTMSSDLNGCNLQSTDGGDSQTVSWMFFILFCFICTIQYKLFYYDSQLKTGAENIMDR
jgi:hypothetical protein